MALLLLDRAHLKVGTDGAALVIEGAATPRRCVPIALIERCVIQGADIQVDSSVMLKLAEAGVPLVFMSPRLQRRVAYVHGPGHNEAALRLAQYRLASDPAAARPWATAVVAAKLQRQGRTLQDWLRQRPDARFTLVKSLAMVRSCQKALKASEPPDLARLRGLEGVAARASFAGMAAVTAPALGFTGRRRRPPRDPVNALLSLAYAMIHAQAVNACHVAGLDPMLGFYHQPAIGRESLACDLIEPLRPAIDRWVWGLLRDRLLTADHFTMTSGACLLGKAGRGVFYPLWQQAQGPWQRWLRLQARTLARHLREGSTALPAADPADEEF